MESEKVKVIKELLRCMNGEKACTNCYINEVAEEQETFCMNVVADMTLELINELERENERLRTCREADYKTMTALRQANTKLNECMDEMQDRIAELEEEKKTIKESCNRGIDRIHELSIKIAELKKEKQKQLLDFVKALKTITCEMYLKEQLHGAIDTTLKNFVKDI